MTDEFDEDTVSLPLAYRPEEILLPKRVRSLLIVKGPALLGDGGRRIPLANESVVLGRSRTADFRLDAPSLSRQHARFFHQNHEQLVEDLESRNGVFLNGIKISSAVLRDGDLVQIGDVVLEYRDNAS